MHKYYVHILYKCACTTVSVCVSSVEKCAQMAFAGVCVCECVLNVQSRCRRRRRRCSDVVARRRCRLGIEGL